MKKNGILNSDIDKILADLGHTDTLIIADMGLPIPKGVSKIDLALKPGTPSFIDVLSIMLNEMAVESVTVASEIKQNNIDQLNRIEDYLTDSTPINFVSHAEFKKESENAKVIIRTGENSPYSNIILQAGVTF